MFNRIKAIKSKMDEKRRRRAVWAARDAIINLMKTKAADFDVYMTILETFDEKIFENGQHLS